MTSTRKAIHRILLLLSIALPSCADEDDPSGTRKAGASKDASGLSTPIRGLDAPAPRISGDVQPFGASENADTRSSDLAAGVFLPADGPERDAPMQFSPTNDARTNDSSTSPADTTNDSRPTDASLPISVSKDG